MEKYVKGFNGKIAKKKKPLDRTTSNRETGSTTKRDLINWNSKFGGENTVGNKDVDVSSMSMSEPLKKSGNSEKRKSVDYHEWNKKFGGMNTWNKEEIAAQIGNLDLSDNNNNDKNTNTNTNTNINTNTITITITITNSNSNSNCNKHEDEGAIKNIVENTLQIQEERREKTRALLEKARLEKQKEEEEKQQKEQEDAAQKEKIASERKPRPPVPQRTGPTSVLLREKREEEKRKQEENLELKSQQSQSQSQRNPPQVPQRTNPLTTSALLRERREEKRKQEQQLLQQQQQQQQQTNQARQRTMSVETGTTVDNFVKTAIYQRRPSAAPSPRPVSRSTLEVSRTPNRASNTPEIAK